MSNGVAAAVAAGVLSFGAALGVSFILFGEAKSDAKATAEIEGLKAKIATLESAKNSSQSNPVVEKFDGVSTNELNDRERKIKKTIDDKFSDLDTRLKNISVEGAVPAKIEGVVDAEAIKQAILNDLQGSFNDLADQREEMLANERDEARAAERAAAVEKVRLEAPQQVVDRITKALTAKNMSAQNIDAFKTAYVTRLDRIIAMDQEMRDARDAGTEIDRDAFRKRLEDAQAADKQTFVAALGEEAYTAVENEIRSQDWQNMRSGVGASAMQALGGGRTMGGDAGGRAFGGQGGNPGGNNGNNGGNRNNRRGG